ncbi:tetratricopeptide repeat protein [Marinobacter sp.]|uniref:tetratricopeptide repeat protein n=1 Tax=Marinobacter sp. TaxID=50741 RepID=UPI0035699EF6
MKPHFFRARVLPLLISAFLSHGYVSAQESFRVELGKDGETLRDMRPVFLKFEVRPLPAISPAEVARRYQKLFDGSDEPEVRIDALNRLNNIRDRSGQDIGFTEEREAEIYEEVLDSYENILSKGSFSGRLDELLYQMAKAHALTGQQQESVQRLRQLVGLYPKSDLVAEARFRIAEAGFSAGKYQDAEAGYRALLAVDNKQELATKAQYMMGWSQFKQGEQAWNRAAETFMDLLDEQLPGAEQVAHPPESGFDMVEDSLRVLGLMASRMDDYQTLNRWVAGRSGSAWRHILYDRLADLHAVEGRYAQAVAVNDAFIQSYPEHRSEPDFMVQSIVFWQMAGDISKARQAKAEFVSRFLPDTRYQSLATWHQKNWRDYSRFLADDYYATGTEYDARGNDAAARRAWGRAASYYEKLAGRSEAEGELMHLAGDARLLAGNRSQALGNFRRAGYGQGYERASEAAWAAISVLREPLASSALGSAAKIEQALIKLGTEEQRYSDAFGVDARLSVLRADLANRWYDAGDLEAALSYSKKTIEWPEVRSEESYSAWLVIGRVRQRNREFSLAERAWRTALGLAENEAELAVPDEELADIREQLAVAIYRQGEAAADSGNTRLAVAHFQRVNSVLPGSELAIKARFDAANTLLKASEWLTAINELKRFRSDYPDHELTAETGDKLVLAYQQSGQPLKAAGELLAAASKMADPWPYRLRAAAIYHESGETDRRNTLYRDWLAIAPLPANAGDHVQQQTMRQRLIESGSTDSQSLQALVNIESRSQWHSEETLTWAGEAALQLGARAADDFAAIALVHPLEETLARKQKALQQAQQYFLEAESFAGEPVVSEVLFRRAELYRGLANDLMNSEVPSELNELEAMQYQMLLEEEAYPLEERAMELHKKNHQRIAVRGFDDWIGKSLEALSVMHPGRYSRELRWMSWTVKESDGV